MSTSPATSASTRASSKAESPPPTTTRRLPWKNGPSHEAHRDTPRPANSASPGIPSSRRADPAARMIARACRVPSLEARSEEHTSELQSRGHLVCRLLLEKKKTLETKEIK